MNIIGKYRDNKWLGIIAGILLAFIIITTQASEYYFGEGIPISVSLEDNKEDGEKAPLYISHDAIAVSSVQLNIDKPFQVVFELLLPNDEKPNAKPETIPLCLDFFKILFRLTIAPNAP